MASSLSEGASEEIKDLTPRFDGRLGTVTGTRDREECVTRPFVGVEFVFLTSLGQCFIQRLVLFD